MRATLRPVDPADPRPQPFDDAVVDRACQPFTEEMSIWLRAETRGGQDVAPDLAGQACRIVIQHTKGDPWAAAKLLEKTFYWPMDLDGARVVEKMTRALLPAWKASVGEWVMRTNYRFPGRKGDQIEWVDAAGGVHAGTIHGVEGALAAAIVIPSEPGVTNAARVFAENVFGNSTQGLYAAFASAIPTELPQPETVAMPEKPVATLRPLYPKPFSPVTFGVSRYDDLPSDSEPEPA